jgi:hypothetical protein
MEWVKLLLDFLKEVVPTLTTFIVGRKSKELEQLKDENDKLKKYDDIENDEHSLNDVYTSSMWK